MNELVIPSEMESEIALIGCVFLDESILYQVADMLDAEDFYFQKNKLIYKAMLDLLKKGQNIDVTTVVSKLTNDNMLEQCGGLEYISSIADYSYSTANFETYVELILNASLRRNAINTLGKLAQDGYNNKQTAFDYIESVERQVFELSKRRRVSSFDKVSEVAAYVLEKTEKNANRNDDVIGYDTGFSSLNKYTQGFQPGQLIILAARPAMGKSAFAMNLAINVANRNKGGEAAVAIFSLEMGSDQLVERMLASESSIRLNTIKSGRLAKNEWARFTTSCTKLGSMNLYFDDSADSSISSIRAKCRKLKADSGLDFIVIDYLQLIESDSSLARASQQEKISKISRSLKLMARELEVPVLALSQLSRAVEQRDEKRPIMADLRDSGSIEQDADIVMFLYRDDYYNHSSERKGEADLIISKNRSGSTHEGLPFIFTPEHQRFKEKKDN
jgi:replicative DNA helicase